MGGSGNVSNSSKSEIAGSLSAILLLLALLAPAAPRAEHNTHEIKQGTTEWHYGSDNTVMEEGHRRIRAWRTELQAERRRALESLRGRGPLAKVSGAADFLAGPPPFGTEHTFAEGMIRGKWQPNRITHTSSGSGYGAGVRLDRTVYDPDRNIIYALTTEKNLVEAPLTQLGSWTQQNQSVLIEKLGFTGVKTAAGKFRLIGSIDGVFRYSDDEGRSWTSSNGGNHNLGEVYFTQALGNGHILTHVRKTVGAGVSDVIQHSTDFGATFQDLQSWPVAQSAGIVSTYLYNTADQCLVVRNPAGGGGWEVFQYKNGVFSRLAVTTATGTPVTLTGTLHEGIKVYATTATDGGYYSEDGITWVRRATLKPRLETVHPTQPNLLFANEPQHDISTDGGITWRVYPDNDRTVGWDPKHLTFYKEVGGKWVFVVANDMGLCFNPEPLDTSAGAWRYVNDNHTFGILHGGVAVDYTGLTVTANQDPGTFELIPTGRGSFSAQNRNGADGLRVTASNDGKAYWYKHYWDSFMHNHAAATGDTRKAYFDIPKTNWLTPAFKGSTTPGEDAIYVSGQAKLVKLTYNTSDNTITRLDLPYDFQASAGEVTFGVGVAKSDPSRLYVATRNGRFFHSRDAGATWTETSYTGPKPAPQGATWNQSAGFYIEVADTDPNLVYWGAGGNAVACLLSRDGGRTFQAAQNGLPADARIGALSLSPDGKLAFSSTFHVYIASKNAWYDLRAASMPSGALPAAMALNYLPLQRKVRYFTWGAGVLDLDITYLSTPDQPAVTLSTSACYQLAEAGTGLVLGTNTSGALDLAAATAPTRLKWQLQGVDGFHRLTALGSQKVLDVSGASYAEGGAVGLWDWNSDDNQLWHLVRGSDSLWSLFARHSVKALEAASGQVRQTTWSGAKTQKWRLTQAPNCQTSPVSAAPKPFKAVELIRLASGRFRIAHIEARAFHVLIYDAAGTRVREAKTTDVIDLTGLPQGIYHAKIMSDHVFVTETLAHTVP